MKNLITAILDNHVITEEILKHLSQNGYNGTVIPSTSLKHTLENEGDIPMFISLAHVETDHLENTTIIEIIVEEDDVDEVMNVVREETNSFKDCHGAMYVIPLNRFEGSF